jgi:hypothetical protein
MTPATQEYLMHAKLTALENVQHLDQATAVMVGIDIEGRDIPALTSRALIAAFTASRGWAWRGGLGGL